jgi:NAD(P)-dependent dehydrogenase (short-subunit alcohol dehydrogenase family)
MSLKVIVVTGGNKGIGKALCEKILRSYPETFVYLCSRDASRGSEAVASIIDSVGPDISSRIACLEMVG